MSFGEAIRHFREKAEVSQEELAIKADIKIEVMKLIEEGHRIDPLIMIKIARALNLSVRNIIDKVSEILDEKYTDSPSLLDDLNKKFKRIQN